MKACSAAESSADSPKPSRGSSRYSPVGCAPAAGCRTSSSLVIERVAPKNVYETSGVVPCLRRGSKWNLLGAVVLFLVAGFLGYFAIGIGLFVIGMTTDFFGNPISLKDRLPGALFVWGVGAAFVTPFAVAGYFAMKNYLKPPPPPLPYDPSMGFGSHPGTRDG
jgi:hypothetical protein